MFIIKHNSHVHVCVYIQVSFSSKIPKEKKFNYTCQFCCKYRDTSSLNPPHSEAMEIYLPFPVLQKRLVEDYFQEHGLWTKAYWVVMAAVLRHVTLSTSLNISMPQFLHLQNEKRNDLPFENITLWDQGIISTYKMLLIGPCIQ